MTKHAVTCKNTTDSHEQEEVEEEATASRSNVRTVRKLTGETPDMQGVRDVTGAVMEERWVEEIPLSTREQVLRHLSMERCKVISEADDRVAKSNGSDVGGTWLQLMCCALPKCLCP